MQDQSLRHGEVKISVALNEKFSKAAGTHLRASLIAKGL